jgi:hypothetical protein
VQPLACRRCGNQVMVEKNSLAHTAIQWTESDRCTEFASLGDRELRTRVVGCPALRETIEEAVVAGRIEVPAE